MERGHSARQDPHLGSPECYVEHHTIFYISRTLYQKETLKDYSILWEKINKYAKTLPCNINYMMEDFDASKELLDVRRRYAKQYSIISCQFEKWCAQRRILVKKIKIFSRSITKIKSHCSKGRLICSSVNLAGLFVSSVLHRLNVGWSSKLLLASTAFGCFGSVFSYIEETHNISLSEDVMKELKEYYSLLRTLQLSFLKLRDFDKNVGNLFPHGVDDKIVSCIQKCEDISDSDQNRTDVVISKIFLAVVVSNAKEELTLLEDDGFLMKADGFALTRVAEMWWKRMKSKAFPEPPKSEFKCLKMSSVPFDITPLVTAGICWYGSVLQTLGCVFLNGLVVYCEFCELSRSELTKEVFDLTLLELCLKKEYKDFGNFYLKLSPYSD